MPIKKKSTFLSKITKYKRVPLGFDPSVARLLDHDPTPRQTCPVYNRTSNTHTLTVIHGILKQHAANQNKKLGKGMILEEKVGKIG